LTTTNTGFVNRELDRIARALKEPRSADEYRQLYVAQQALSWDMNELPAAKTRLYVSAD
jgi:hypothetical protein